MPDSRHWTFTVPVIRGSIIASAVLVVGAATLAVFLQPTPWLFLGAFWLAGTLVVGPRLGWASAGWLLVAAALFAAQWVMVLNPYTGLRFDTAMIVVLVLIDLVACLLCWPRNRIPIEVRRPRILDAVVVAAPAVITGVVLLGASLIRGYRAVTWAMTGDAQFNTVLARIVAEDGGMTASNVPVLSLAQGLMALVHLPGRDLVPTEDLLVHDVSRQADLWVAMILLSSVLMGTIAQRALRDSGWILRFVGILGAAALPLSWHLTGYAIYAGFYNVDLTFLVLGLAFYLWLRARSRPLIGAAAALALSTTMLGAWTPMVLIPGAFAAAFTIVGFVRRPVRIVDGVVWAVAVVQLVGFAAVFILPSFLESGSLLSQNGQILPLARETVILVGALLALVAVGVWAVRTLPEDRAFATGSILLILGAAVGTAYLYVQNRHLPQPWIYYPIKFAWVSLEVMLVLIWVGACLIFATLGRRRALAAVGILTTVVLLAGVLRMNPPMRPGVIAAFPLLDIAKNPSPLEDVVDTMSEIANTKVIYSRYYGGDIDLFIDQWQFQLTVRSAEEPIRAFAYQRIETLSDVCDAASAWGGGVEVVTRDERWAGMLEDHCGDLLDAVVREPGRT